MRINSANNTNLNRNYNVVSNSKNTNSPFFGARITYCANNIEAFIKANGAEPGPVKNMFNNIVTHFRKMKADDIIFQLQNKTSDSSNIHITARIDSYQHGIELARKYKKFLTPTEYKKIINQNMYMLDDITDPLVIYRRKSYGGPKFNLDYHDDEKILIDIESHFPIDEGEKEVFLKIVRRKRGLFTRIYRWLDTHGPDEPPIY